VKTLGGDQLCRLRQEIDLFQFLTDDCARTIASYFSLLHVGAGEVLWREGDSCDYVGFIISGRLEVSKETEFPGRQVIIGVYSKGTVVGELCILDLKPRSVTVVALEDSVIGVLPHERFAALLDDHPKIGVRLLKGMLLRVSIRLRKSFDRLADVF